MLVFNTLRLGDFYLPFLPQEKMTLKLVNTNMKKVQKSSFGVKKHPQQGIKKKEDPQKKSLNIIYIYHFRVKRV